MLSLLLDQPISPDIVAAIHRLQREVPVGHVRDRQWQALPDPELLRLACPLGLTLVTYDQASIPDFLRELPRTRKTMPA